MSNWTINASGVTGVLTLSLDLTSPPLSGPVTGTVFGDPLTGYWDNASQTLTFSRATHCAPDFNFEVYTGTRFQPYNTPNGLQPGGGLPGSNVPLMIAGNFGKARAAATFGPFDSLGWFAY